MALITSTSRHTYFTMTNGDKVRFTLDAVGLRYQSYSNRGYTLIADTAITSNITGYGTNPVSAYIDASFYGWDVCKSSVTPNVLHVAGSKIAVDPTYGMQYGPIYGGKLTYNTTTHLFSTAGFTTALLTPYLGDVEWALGNMKDIMVWISEHGGTVVVGVTSSYIIGQRILVFPRIQYRQHMTQEIAGFVGSTFGTTGNIKYYTDGDGEGPPFLGAAIPVPDQPDVILTKGGTLVLGSYQFNSGLTEIAPFGNSYVVNYSGIAESAAAGSFSSLVNDKDGNVDVAFMKTVGSSSIPYQKKITSFNPINANTNTSTPIGMIPDFQRPLTGGLVLYSGEYWSYHAFTGVSYKGRSSRVNWTNGAGVLPPLANGSPYISYESNIVSWYGSAYSDMNMIPNVTLITPADSYGTYDQYRDAINVAWTFTDPEDVAQTSVEIIAQDKTPGAATTWVNSAGGISATRQVLSTSAVTKTINAGALSASVYGYQVIVRVSDYEGSWSPWSAARSFQVASAPYITWEPMAGDYVMSSNHPTIYWSYFDDDYDDCAKKTIRLYDANRVVVFEDKDVSSSAFSGGIDFYKIVEYSLANNASYSFAVTVTDTSGFTSTEAELPITTNIAYPPNPTLTIEDLSVGENRVHISIAPVSGGYLYLLSRWSERVSDYVPLASEYLEYPGRLDFSDAIYPYKQVHYRVTTTNDSDVSLDNDTLSVTIADEPKWEIYGSESHTRAVVSVDSFKYKKSRYQQVYEPLGRRHIVSIENSPKGVEGEIVLQVIEEAGKGIYEPGYFSLRDFLQNNTGTVNDPYIIDPYGNVYKIRPTGFSVQEQGNYRSTITIPFIETGAA